MSDFKSIQALLEKYWEGETTLEEERLIKGYFASDEVDVRLKPFAPMFQAFREEQTVQLNKGKVVPIRPQMYWAAAASIAILLAAGVWWMFSRPDDVTIIADKKQTPVEQPTQNTPPERDLVPNNPVIAQTAISSPKRVFQVKRRVAKMVTKPAINAEEVAAMEEIKAALALVSSKIRKGRTEAAKGAIHLESVDKIFKKKVG